MKSFNDLKAIRFIQGTKVSHDYEGHNVNTFSYKDLIQRNTPSIGIPCKENGLVVIDVDTISDQHKHDGREFWTNFCAEFGIPRTYTVSTPSGGFHFYFYVPEAINLETFRPPAQLAPGVDVKFRGWVGAPPTPGYEIVEGNLSTVQEAPPSLLAHFHTKAERGEVATFDDPTAGLAFTAYKPFSEPQIKELRMKLTWLQTNGELSRAEWRDGLFALKAGIDDPELLDELADLWTYNQSFEEGDEKEARAIVERADKYGPIGPGTIFAIINDVMRRSGVAELATPFTIEEIITKSKVTYKINKEGAFKIEPSESNAAALIGAMFSSDDLYHDIRSDLYVFKGQSVSDTDLCNLVMPMIQSTHSGLGLEKIRKASIKAGIDILLANRQRDPHVEYLNSLTWDGVDRIETFFIDFLKVEDTPYHRQVSKNFWTALAARGLRPGCKFDSVVILEGAEGARKSSLVEAIGGDYTFVPSRRDAFENSDELRKMHQSVIVELPELMGLVNETSEKVKAFLATSFDYIRELYARKATRKDRGFIFVGTTNSSQYITASMGLRRFWPVKLPATLTAIDIDGVNAVRDQLYAEAIQYFKDGYKFYEMPKEFLAAESGSKVITDPIAEAISEMVGAETTVQTTDIYRRLEAAGYISRGLNIKTKTRIEDCFVALGFESSFKGKGVLEWKRTFTGNVQPSQEVLNDFANII